MFHARQDLAFGRPIALQFIGDDHAWDVLESFEELPKKSFRCVCVPSALDQDIQHVAVLIDGSPQIRPFSIDGEKDARPGATCLRTEGDGDGVRSRTSDQTSNTTAARCMD
jgi:hypothetical protein